MDTPTSGQSYILFTERDLDVFSEASGDRNPLHLNPEYARRTPYGQPVVFGCLGAIACLGHIPLSAAWSVTSLETNFIRPLFPGVRYRVEKSGENGCWKARVFDGSTLVVSLTVTAENAIENTEKPSGIAPISVVELRHVPVRRGESMAPGLAPGLKVSGSYGCNAAALAALQARWGCASELLATVLCWASYVVGMELPGESALFSRLQLHFPGTMRPVGSMSFDASVVSVDTRFGLIEVDVSLSAGADTIARGQCSSYIRPPVPEPDEFDFAGVRPDSLAGRVAVVLGSSRGLGAAIKRALGFRSATVYGMARQGDAGDQSRTEVGDAADPEAVQRLRERVSREHGRLDFLICNACPPIQPLRLEPNATGRVESYINLAISLTLTPLSEFLELLNGSDGCAVIISSAAVESPVREWPHYVAAKQAVEALARVASLQYPRVSSLIVRPPKMLTAMTNTPLHWLPGASPGLVANRIVARLEDPMLPTQTEILGFSHD